MTMEPEVESGEEMESPRSPAVPMSGGGGRRRRRWRKFAEYRDRRGYVHSQVLRIKEEELQIGTDLIGDYSYHDDNYHPFDDRLVIWSRSILPASPLSGRKIGGND